MGRIYLEGITLEELWEFLIQKFTEHTGEAKSANPNNSKEEYFTREKTAEILHVTLPTLFRWDKNGKLKANRIGSRVYYRKSTIDSALSSSEKKRSRGPP